MWYKVKRIYQWSNLVRPSIPTNWLVSRYKLDWNLNDSYWSYNLTQWETPSYVTGKYWQAINTWYGYTTISWIASIFTIRFFMKCTSINKIWIELSMSSNFSASDFWRWRYDLWRTRYWTSGSTNWIAFNHYKNQSSSTDAYQSLSSYTTITDWNWHQIVCTKNWTSAQLFVDWIKEATGTFADNPASTVISIKWYDIRSDTTSSIDDVLVYNRVRTDEEVATDYANFW
jgi:hypothetical protein